MSISAFSLIINQFLEGEDGRKGRREEGGREEGREEGREGGREAVRGAGVICT